MWGGHVRLERRHPLRPTPNPYSRVGDGVGASPKVPTHHGIGDGACACTLHTAAVPRGGLSNGTLRR